MNGSLIQYKSIPISHHHRQLIRKRSTSFGTLTQLASQIVVPLEDDAGPVNDDADTAGANDVISDDQIRLVQFETRTLAVEVLGGNPDDLVASTYLVFCLLEDVQYVDGQLDPVADRFT